MFTGEDELIDGEVQEGKLYKEADFNRIIVTAREASAWTMLIKEKAIIFCATQDHAAVRDLVNQSKSTKQLLCVLRLTMEK
jgi:type I restriction enzyme R subunit